MTRNEKLLAHISLDQSEGLEIGALCDPVVPRDCSGISYVDHLDTAGLRKKYEKDPHVDIERIVPVRYVWTGGPLVDVVGSKRFDYVVASHVAEHVPDLIGWFKHIAQVLRAGGLLALAVPDMRYTFDCQRNLTTIADLLQAYFEQYRCPSIRQVLDHFLHKVEVPEQCSVASLWEDATRAASVQRSRPFLLQELGEAGLRRHFDAIRAGEYIDTHCTVVTPASFIRLLAQLATLDLSFFTVKSFHPTLPNEQDFVVVLEKLPDSVASQSSPAERQRFVLERFPAVS
jgi:SAM-dependent methyltransferase